MTPAPFHPTRWTLVRQAGQNSEAGRAALSELCAAYYLPVHQFIRIRHGHDARDLTHTFFQELLTRENLGSPDPAHGRFRTYLLGAVKHFLSRHAERATAQKRGAGQTHVPLDASIPADPDDTATFDRDWALNLIRRAHDNLEAEMQVADKSLLFETLHPWLDGGPQASADEAAAKLGLSPNALRVAIHRLRLRFRQLVRAEVEATTGTTSDTDAEFQHLLSVLAQSPSPRG